MSLDVYLRARKAEWMNDGWQEVEPVTVFSANITNNLGMMAEAVGVHEACWCPEEIGATKAKDIAPILRAGLERLKADPAKYEKLNSPSGWGTYADFVPWLEKYLLACEKHPDAVISIY